MSKRSDKNKNRKPDISKEANYYKLKTKAVQDLVEAEIRYGAIFGNEKTLCYQPDLFRDLPDRFPEICPDCQELWGIVQVREVNGLAYYLDSVSNYAVCGIE